MNAENDKKKPTDGYTVSIAFQVSTSKSNVVLEYLPKEAKQAVIIWLEEAEESVSGVPKMTRWTGLWSKALIFLGYEKSYTP